MLVLPALIPWLCAGQAWPGADAYHFAVELPARIHRGKSAALILRVQKDGRPADQPVACMEPAPLFASAEDVADTTPALGSDLGIGSQPPAEPSCVAAIAAVRIAPGVYRFTWEPDTAGRVDLRFRVGEGRFTAPVNVESAPPNPAVLAGFAVLAGAILAVAHRMRGTRHQRGAP